MMIPWPAVIMLVFAVIAVVALVWLVLIEYAAVAGMTDEDWQEYRLDVTMRRREEESKNGNTQP